MKDIQMKKTKIAVVLSLSVAFFGVANVSAEEKLDELPMITTSEQLGWPTEEWEWLQSHYLDNDGEPIGVVYKEIPDKILEQAKEQYLIPIVRSAFTKAEYKNSIDALSEIGLKDESSFITADYNVDKNVLVITGGFDSKRIPQALSNKQKVIFEYSEEAGGRGTRMSDAAPHYGGSRVKMGPGYCSTSARVYTGTLWGMITAGHCGGYNTAATSPGGQSFGTVQYRAPFPSYDFSILRGSTYSSYFYTGNATSTATIAVSGALNPTVASSGWCTGGSYTFEKCGKTVSSLTGSLCDSAGCTNTLVTVTGGSRTTLGDSGGPLYQKVSTKVRFGGSIVGGDASKDYIQRWSTIVAVAGASL